MWDCPTDPFKTLEPQNPSIDELSLLRKCISTNFEALKWGKVRSGKILFHSQTEIKVYPLLAHYFFLETAGILYFGWWNLDKTRSENELCPTDPFTILKSNNHVSDLYLNRKRQSTNVVALKLRKGRSGVGSLDRSTSCFSGSCFYDLVQSLKSSILGFTSSELAKTFAARLMI